MLSADLCASRVHFRIPVRAFDSASMRCWLGVLVAAIVFVFVFVLVCWELFVGFSGGMIFMKPAACPFQHETHIAFEL